MWVPLDEEVAVVELLLERGWAVCSSVLGYSPLQVGLVFLPANLIMAVLSLGLSAKLVLRFGIRTPLAALTGGYHPAFASSALSSPPERRC